MVRTKHGVELSEDYIDEKGRPSRRGAKIPYTRGSEIFVGDFKPRMLFESLSSALERTEVNSQIEKDTESPIELQLGAAIALFFKRAGKPLEVTTGLPTEEVDKLYLVPQFPWSYYRSDWAILNTKTKGVLLIECDGAEFHSSLDQRAHDRRKDAAARDRGWLTLRFRGKEIFKDADQCAQKVYDAVYGGAE